ncbi:MAG: hypothetical protein M3Y40_03495 [Chloroflexota bacterium]|nr:hypothetical protein [Chloroflexota bacterium]
MSAFGLGGYATVQEVEVELFTSAYRVAGTIHTPFRRVAELLNQLPGAHLTIENATVSAHGEDARGDRVSSALVTVDEVIVLMAPALVGETSSEMRILKHPAHAILSIPPLRLEGTIHVPVGSNPVDGMLNVPERFMPMTDVSLTSPSHPTLDRTVPILALRRDRAHVIVINEPAEAGTEHQPEAEEGAAEIG